MPSRPLEPEYVSPIHGFGFASLCVFLFLAESRILDVVTHAFKIPFLLQTTVLIVVLLTGRAGLWLTTRTGRCLAAFSVWALFTAPFAYWRSAILDSGTEVLRSVVLFVMITGLIATREQLGRAVAAMALAFITAASVSFIADRQVEGIRVGLEQGSYKDPNTLALAMVAGVPLVVWLLGHAKTKLVRLIALVGLIPVLMAFARTGSRGGFIGLAGVFVVMFFAARAPQKAGLLVGLLLMACVAAAVVSPQTRERFFTYSKTSADADGDEELEASASERWMLFQQSVAATLSHPIVGVGPGSFQAYNFDLAKRENRRVRWLVPHNTYTQVSAETGIPGLVFFVLMLTIGFAALRSVRKARVPEPPQNWRELVSLVSHLRYMLIGVCLCCFFLSYPYYGLIHVSLAFVAAAERIAAREAARSGVRGGAAA